MVALFATELLFKVSVNVVVENVTFVVKIDLIVVGVVIAVDVVVVIVVLVDVVLLVVIIESISFSSEAFDGDSNSLIRTIDLNESFDVVPDEP